MRTLPSFKRAALASAVAVCVGGCGGGMGEVEVCKYGTPVLDPVSKTIDAGTTLSVGVTVNYSEGDRAACNARSVPFVSWRSDNPAIATVSTSGATTDASGNMRINVTGLAVGTTSIVASVTDAEGVHANSMTVTVTIGSPASVAVTSPVTTLGVGADVTFTAVVKDGGGNTIPSPSLTWRSSSDATATVSATGVVHGVAAGDVTITATSGTASGSASVRVLSGSLDPVVTVDVLHTGLPGPSRVVATRTITLAATPRGGLGQVLTGRVVTWQTSDASRATVADGVVTGVAIGTATITATVDGVRGTHVVNVAPGPVGSIAVTPVSSSIAQGDQATLSVTLRDTLGAIVTGPTVAWTSSNETIATVSAAGVVTGVAPGGPVTITALHATGVSGTAMVTVSPPRFAYTLADQPSAASYTPLARYTFNSSGGAISITRASTGNYQVRFAGQATPDSKSEVVLVTAFGPGEVYCKHGAPWANAGTDLVANVACFTTLGTPADMAFNITLIGSGALGGRFGYTYADQETTPSYFPPTRTYSSARQPIAVTRLSAGAYRVSFAGLSRSTPASPETLMLTTIGAGSARCAFTGGLAVESIDVHCYDAPRGDGTLIDAKFAVALVERGRPGGRAAFGLTRPEPAVAFETGETYNSTGGPISITRSAAGVYDVTFGGLAIPGAVVGGETIQLSVRTGFGTHCKVVTSNYVANDLVVRVTCYHEDATGPEDHDFRILVLQ